MPSTCGNGRSTITKSRAAVFIGFGFHGGCTRGYNLRSRGDGPSHRLPVRFQRQGTGLMIQLIRGQSRAMQLLQPMHDMGQADTFVVTHRFSFAASDAVTSA
jgi:hypothetical protein